MLQLAAPHLGAMPAKPAIHWPSRAAESDCRFQSVVTTHPSTEAGEALKLAVFDPPGPCVPEHYSPCPFRFFSGSTGSEPKRTLVRVQACCGVRSSAGTMRS